MKHQVYWITVCGKIPDVPCRNICFSDIPAEVLHEHLSLLVGRCVPTKIISACAEQGHQMINACFLPAFGLKQELIFGAPA